MSAKLDFTTLSRTGKPLLLPGAHDALSSRMIENVGFAAYGIGGLRVIDASAFPSQISGNRHATVMMLGEMIS